MQIEKNALISAIDRVMPGISKGKTDLAGMDTIIIDEVGLHAFNGTICATVALDTGGIKGAVVGDKFFKLVKSLKGDDVLLEHTDAGLLVKCGRNKTTLSWIVDIATPEFIAEYHNMEPSIPLPEDFQDALRVCNIPTNTKDYAGTIFCDNNVYSTDQIRSNIYKFETPLLDDAGAPAKFWVSLQNSLQLLKLNDKFTHYTKRHTLSDGTVEEDVWVHFKTSEGTIFSCTLLNMEPANVVIPFLANFGALQKEEGETEGILPQDFPDAIKRVGVVSSKSQDGALDFVKLTFSKESLAINSKSKAGTSDEVLDWPTDGIKIKESFSCLYPVSYLTEIYEKAKEFFVKELQGGNGPVTVLIFNSGGYRHLVSNLSDPG